MGKPITVFWWRIPRPTPCSPVKRWTSVGFRCGSPRLEDALPYIGGRFDVVLLDLGLPDSQGIETLRQVRRQTGAGDCRPDRPRR